MSKYTDFLLANEIMGLLIQLELLDIWNRGGVFTGINWMNEFG